MQSIEDTLQEILGMLYKNHDGKHHTPKKAGDEWVSTLRANQTWDKSPDE